MAEIPIGSAGAGGGRLLSSLQGLTATLIAIAHTRLELLTVELEQEKRRMLAVLGWGAMVVLMGTVSCVFLAGFITVLFWEHNPLLVLGLMTLFFIAFCVLAAVRVKALIHSPGGLLADTLAELQADHEALMRAAGRRPDPAESLSTEPRE